MQYLSWADILIPLCFVTGFSYSKRARVTEHSGGFASSRGYETSEISVRVSLSRNAAVAYGLDFSECLRELEDLTADKDNAQGTVSLGGYPIYPELNFALTNINKTYLTDLSTNDISSLEADITLSGVSCVKEVSRERALIFDLKDTAIELPKVTLTCKGKSLVVQDSLSIARFETAPDRIELEIYISQDDRKPERKGFLESIVRDYATVTCDLPQGTVTYNIINCMQVDNVMQISGAVFPETASQTATKTFVDCDLSEIIRAICDIIGIDADIRVSGKVDYYLMKCTPMEALEALQKSAGFVVSRQGNKITFGWLPDSIQPQKTLNLNVTDDTLDELSCGLIWRDGVNEANVGDVSGNVPEVQSVFRSSEGEYFAKRILSYQRYLQSYIRIEDAIDETIGSHSQVAIVRNNVEVPVLVDYPIFNWLDGTMILECREVR